MRSFRLVLPVALAVCSGFQAPTLVRPPIHASGRVPARGRPSVALRVRGGGLFGGDGGLEAARALTSTPLGSLAFVAAYVSIEMCGIPSVPLAAAAGVLYPAAGALALVLGSSTLAACLAFQVGRTKLRPKLEGRIKADKKLGAIDAAVRENGFPLLLLLRLVPMPPAINYVYGAIKPTWRAYVAATVVGYCPGTLMTVLAAAGAGGPLLGGGRPPWYAYAGGVAAAAALFAALAATAKNVKATLDEYERRLA